MTQPAAMIGHHTWLMPDPAGRPPEYKLYRTRPRLLRRGARRRIAARRAARARRRGDAPAHGAGSRVGRVRQVARARARSAGSALARPVPASRAQVSQDQVSADAAGRSSTGGGVGRSLEPQTILVLGSDQRTAGHEGARREHVGPEPLGLDPARCASAAATARSSRSRATPSSTSPATAATRSTPPTRSAAPRSRSQTIKQYLGHRRSTTSSRSTSTTSRSSSTRWAAIDYTGGCVVSRINGGFKNGGFTLRLHGGHDAHRRQAGARARAHAPERCATRKRERPHPRAPPAEGHRRDEVARASARPASSACRGSPGTRRRRCSTDMGGPALLGYAIGDARSAAARTTRDPQALGRRDAARRRRGPRPSRTPRSRPRSQRFLRGLVLLRGGLRRRRRVRLRRSSLFVSTTTTTTTSSTCPCAFDVASCRRRPWPSARARGCAAWCRSRCCRSPCP